MLHISTQNHFVTIYSVTQFKLYFLNELFPKRLDTTLMQSAREVLTSELKDFQYFSIN